MRVTLPEQLADLVQRKLDSGLYASSEEVIAVALELLELR
ncbi:MAG: type II toxin-antitoxin system ParD family antitoxin, partial [Chloroflexi bacterium]|nr:type II toxin-antitoxin system ParD family antitoxin [Chloroflexota bacterium]